MRTPKVALKNHPQETQLFNSRVLRVGLCMGFLILLLLLRLCYLQWLEHRFYSTLSLQNILNVVPIAPKRGLLFDRNGVCIANNQVGSVLTIIPDKTQNLTASLQQLKTIVDLNDLEIQHFYRIRNQYHPFQPIPLKMHLSEQEAARFYVNQFQFPGFYIETQMQRIYPQGTYFSHVVGYVGRINSHENKALTAQNYTSGDSIGKIGIEKFYEPLLRGQMGFQQVEINANGHIIRSLKQTPAISGTNLILTLDSHLQMVAEEAFGEDTGALVALDPNNGDVLAMVSHPTYDANAFAAGISTAAYQALVQSEAHPLYDRALRGLFAPGSTIKPFVAIGALDEGVIDANYTIHDPGWFQVPDTTHRFKDWLHQGHGTVNVTRAITVSCDTFFYNLANLMGIKRLDDTLARFGFDAKTGLDTTGELSGLIPTPAWKRHAHGQSWFTGDTVITAIGQGFLLVTPLQLAVATGMIAMQGKRYTPHLIKAMQMADGQLQTVPPELQTTLHLQHPEIWPLITHAMEQVIVSPEGTGGHLFGRHPSYTVAAKSGTAQMFGLRGNEDQVETNIPRQLRDNHLFIAFAPIDHPRIALAVAVEHNNSASKIARKVLDYYFAHSKASEK